MLEQKSGIHQGLGPVLSAECSYRHIRLLSRVERRHEMRHDGDVKEGNGGVDGRGPE